MSWTLLMSVLILRYSWSKWISAQVFLPFFCLIYIEVLSGTLPHHIVSLFGTCFSILFYFLSYRIVVKWKRAGPKRRVKAVGGGGCLLVLFPLHLKASLLLTSNWQGRSYFPNFVKCIAEFGLSSPLFTCSLCFPILSKCVNHVFVRLLSLTRNAVRDFVSSTQFFV